MSLTWKEAKKGTNNVLNYIDTIDLLPYLKEFKNNTVGDMMNKLENDYPYKDEYSSILFDLISEEEFVNYLNKRYSLNIQKTTYTYYYI